jgi:hypothetical protein
VFADLGLADAEQLLSRAKLGFHVYEPLRGYPATFPSDSRYLKAA